MQQSACGCSGKVDQFAIANRPQSAKSSLVLPNGAFVAAQRTADAGKISRWPRG